MSHRPIRRSRRISAKEREIAALLRSLADNVEDGKATANFRIEMQPQKREIWLIAAAVTPPPQGTD